MDQSELTRIKKVVSDGERLDREINQLREAEAKAKTMSGVNIEFSKEGKGFDISYKRSGDTDYERWCACGLISDLSEDLRKAFLDVLRQRLNEREVEYKSLTVA